MDLNFTSSYLTIINNGKYRNDDTQSDIIVQLKNVSCPSRQSRSPPFLWYTYWYRPMGEM